MQETLFILYVKDQWRSARFYKELFLLEPRLHEPGMTEFSLPTGGALGLMPIQGVRNSLGDKLPDPSIGLGIPRSELYLLVENPREYHLRALSLGGLEISPLKERSWGHRASYCLDPDGHMLAFAQKIETDR